MTHAPPRSVPAAADLSDALKLLAENGLNQVPVVDNGRVLGMLSRADVLRFLQFRDELGLGAARTPKAQPRSIG